MARGRSQSVGITLGKTAEGNGDEVETDDGGTRLGIPELLEGPFLRDSDWLCGRVVG